MAVGSCLVDPNKGFVLHTDASDYAVGAVLEEVRDTAMYVPVAFWSRILAEGQRRTWSALKGRHMPSVCAQEVVGPHRTAARGGMHRPSVAPELAQGARGHSLETGGQESPMA